jgi:murein DD-endopeptidase MepM/ murein hydrolase activator NlpD
MRDLPELPPWLTLTIERYKIISLISYCFGILTLMALFVALTYKTAATTTVSAAESIVEAPVLSHTVVNIDPAKLLALQEAQRVVGPVWPLRGNITTQYGVPHRPWQHTHTGIDISSGQSSGRAPITTFKEGVVADVVRSSSNYGNHIIVDHGSGITSLYGHLSSIRVTEGQQVRPGDVLGYEGSTGASTGTHLHFQIMKDGSPVSPWPFIPGRP